MLPLMFGNNSQLKPRNPNFRSSPLPQLLGYWRNPDLTLVQYIQPLNQSSHLKIPRQINPKCKEGIRRMLTNSERPRNSSKDSNN